MFYKSVFSHKSVNVVVIDKYDVWCFGQVIEISLSPTMQFVENFARGIKLVILLHLTSLPEHNSKTLYTSEPCDDVAGLSLLLCIWLKSSTIYSTAYPIESIQNCVAFATEHLKTCDATTKEMLPRYNLAMSLAVW